MESGKSFVILFSSAPSLHYTVVVFIYLFLEATSFIYFAVHIYDGKMIYVLVTVLVLNDEKNMLTKKNAFQSAHNVPRCSTGTVKSMV